MFSTIMGWVPFWKTLSCYSREDKRAAIPKFLILWAMSLAPVLLAAVLQQMPAKESMIFALFNELGSSFFGTHQFIYAVSFITPIFYLVWERDQGVLRHIFSGKRSTTGLKITPPGFGVVLVWSIIFFMLTTVSYAIAESRSVASKSRTILEAGTYYSTIVVYLFGLACWYFMILDESASPVAEYYEEVRLQKKEEKEQAKSFSERVSNSEEEE
jgi:hypothetical protein